MRQQLPGGLSREILEKVVTRRLEDKHGTGSATPMNIECLHPFRATIEIIDPNKVWVHVYLIWQEGSDFYFECEETRGIIVVEKISAKRASTNFGDLLQEALSKKR